MRPLLEEERWGGGVEEWDRRVRAEMGAVKGDSEGGAMGVGCGEGGVVSSGSKIFFGRSKTLGMLILTEGSLPALANTDATIWTSQALC